MKQNKIVVGLTGTIASGKSTVARYFAERYGIPMIDADKVGHEILREAAVKTAVVGAFGEGILDEAGEILRSRLGAIVFAAEDRLAQLNAITHPAICGKIRAWIAEQQEEVPFILVEAIELLRSELADMVDEVWVVYADPRVRYQRMTQERGLTGEAASDRIESQWDDEDYMAKAHRIINGSGTVAELQRQCDEIFSQLQEQEAVGKEE